MSAKAAIKAAGGLSRKRGFDMPTTANQNPEQKARDVIDAQLDASVIRRIKKSAFGAGGKTRRMV